MINCMIQDDMTLLASMRSILKYDFVNEKVDILAKKSFNNFKRTGSITAAVRSIRIVIRMPFLQMMQHAPDMVRNCSYSDVSLA